LELSKRRDSVAESTPPRRHVVLGSDEFGGQVCIPTSDTNILITGDSGVGKSYVAGLLAEQLICQRYSVLMVDPKGDNNELERLPNVLAFGKGGRPLPAVDVLIRLIRSQAASLIADLSGIDDRSLFHYLQPLPAVLAAQRFRTGLPQWLILDEAHMFMGPNGGTWSTTILAAKGFCFATWRPYYLPTEMLSAIDVTIVVNGSKVVDDQVVKAVSKAAGMTKRSIALQLASMPQQALVIMRGSPAKVTLTALSARLTNHVRHASRQNYLRVPDERRFYFRFNVNALTPYTAGSPAELEVAVSRCDPSVLRHHCPRNDFSRWVRHVFHDEQLASRIEAVEREVYPDSGRATIEAARIRLVGALQDGS
jgi:hypothetical protein